MQQAAAKPKKGRGGSTTKLAISFDGDLAVQVQRAARNQTAGNVSAWLAEAARNRLRLEAGRQVGTDILILPV